MNLRQLRYFIAVAEHLNFTEAAKQLYIAQSAISQQIADLEKKLGVQLFTRNKRSVQLTNAGKVLQKEAIIILNRAEEAIKRTKQAELGIVVALSIGFLGYTEKIFMPYLIRCFGNNYPEIDLHLDQYNHGMLIELLENNELDIGFTLDFAVEKIDGFERKNIFTEKLSIVMSHDHPLAEKTSLKISDLTNENFIVLNKKESPQGFNKTLLICGNNGFSPNIVSEPRLLSTILLLVDSGMGIALLPESLKNNSSRTLRFIDIEGEDYQYKLIVTWKKNNSNPAIPLFLNELDAFSSENKLIV